MYTYANQKVIHIEKEKYKDNFLQIGIAEWQAASKDLAPAAFKLYLYLASNADGFNLALSQAACAEAIGLKNRTYYRAVEELQDKGYITLKQGNIFNFHCKPAKNDSLANTEKITAKNDSLPAKNDSQTCQK